MKLVVDEGPTSNTGVAAIRLSVFTLRFLENWQGWIKDFDKILILHAVAAISLERLTRKGVPPEVRSIKQQFPDDLIGYCNISSIAAAIGFSRETARRKVAELIEEGALTKLANGSIYFRSGAFHGSDALAILHKQYEAVASLANDLVRDGVLKTSPGEEL